MKDLINRPQDVIIGISELTRVLGFSRGWVNNMVKADVLKIVETPGGKIFDRQQVIKFKKKI